ncbi:MAG: hypothetical protein RIR79_1242, partial [Pseudomonadota bacterium]
MKTHKFSLSTLALLCLSCYSAAPVLAGTCQSNIAPVNPDNAYINNGDGTVTHNATGLVWKRCLEGQTLSSTGTCAGTPTPMNWVSALLYSKSANFANQTDWRLPNIKELRSLAEECRTSPSINDTIFPNTPSTGVWSGSPKSTYPSYVWGVTFDSGTSSSDFPTNGLLVRLVRGGNSLAALGIPVCTVVANTNSVVKGSGALVTLTANCTQGTVKYQWSDPICGLSTSKTCTITPDTTTIPVPSSYSYTVAGLNASNQQGASATTTITVTTATSSAGTYNAKNGLVWKSCLEGQTWDTTTSSCIGTPTVYSFSQANTFNTNPVSYASLTNWRLPTIRELLTIADDTLMSPATSTTLFPNTPAYATVWSSTLGASASGLAWYAGFNRGTAQLDGYTGSRAVRLVSEDTSDTSTSPYKLPLFNMARPSSDYKDLGNGTVTHIPTNLMWQRCLIGQTWDGTTCTGTAGLFTWAQTLQLPTSNNFVSYTDWRLPTQKELLSLVDYTVANPAINSTIFPNNGNSIVWSKTAFVGNASFQWLVSFANGDNLLNLPGDAYAARLVRGSALPTTPISTAPTSMLPLTTTSITDAA